MIKSSYVYCIIAAVIIGIAYSIVLMFGPFGNHQPANAAEIEHNSTSTICIEDKPLYK